MDKYGGFFRFVWFITVSGLGGFLLSLTGLPVGWMIGTLLVATSLSILRPKFMQLPSKKKWSSKILVVYGTGYFRN